MKNIMKNKTLSAVVAVALVLAMLLSSFAGISVAPKTAFAEEKEPIGSIYMSVDASTLGMGFIAEPAVLDLYEGDSVYDVFARFLESEGVGYSYVNGWYGAYIAGIEDGIKTTEERDAFVAENIPAHLKDAFETDDNGWDGMQPTSPRVSNSDTMLGELDYSSVAGWMYTFSQEKSAPATSLGSTYPVDGDVVRVMFSWNSGADFGHGWGENLVDTYDYDGLVALVATINDSAKKEAWLAEQTNADAYDNAVSYLLDLNKAKSQDEIDGVVASVTELFDVTYDYISTEDAVNIKKQAKLQALASIGANYLEASYSPENYGVIVEIFNTAEAKINALTTIGGVAYYSFDSTIKSADSVCKVNGLNNVGENASGAYDIVNGYKELGLATIDGKSPSYEFYLNASNRFLAELVEAPVQDTNAGDWSMMDIYRGMYTGYDYINYIQEKYGEVDQYNKYGANAEGMEYVAGYEQLVADKFIALKGVLHRVKLTEYARLLMPWSALGNDPYFVAPHYRGAAYSGAQVFYNEDGVVVDKDGVELENQRAYFTVYDIPLKYSSSNLGIPKQGINGPIWTLYGMQTNDFSYYTAEELQAALAVVFDEGVSPDEDENTVWYPSTLEEYNELTEVQQLAVRMKSFGIKDVEAESKSGIGKLTIKGTATHFKQIEYILALETSNASLVESGKVSCNGGWVLSGSTADPDITFMALTSLAPYYMSEERYNETKENAYYSEDIAIDERWDTYEEFKEYYERALLVMSELQGDIGAFYSWGSLNVESTAWGVITLTMLGFDPKAEDIYLPTIEKHINFLTEGDEEVNGQVTTNMVDALLSFWAPTSLYGDDGGKNTPEVGGFKHIFAGNDGGGGSGTSVNGMATDQATYALIAYDRFLKGKNALFDMSDAYEVDQTTLKAKEVKLTLQDTTGDVVIVQSPYSTYLLDKTYYCGDVVLPKGSKLIFPEEDIAIKSMDQVQKDVETARKEKLEEALKNAKDAEAEKAAYETALESTKTTTGNIVLDLKDSDADKSSALDNILSKIESVVETAKEAIKEAIDNGSEDVKTKEYADEQEKIKTLTQQAAIVAESKVAQAEAEDGATEKTAKVETETSTVVVKTEATSSISAVLVSSKVSEKAKEAMDAIAEKTGGEAVVGGTLTITPVGHTAGEKVWVDTGIAWADGKTYELLHWTTDGVEVIKGSNVRKTESGTVEFASTSFSPFQMVAKDVKVGGSNITLDPSYTVGGASVKPEVTPQPTEKPEVTEAPTAKPSVTPTPTVKPEATPAPTQAPTPAEGGSNAWIWIALAVLAVGAVAFVVYKKKK